MSKVKTANDRSRERERERERVNERRSGGNTYPPGVAASSVRSPRHGDWERRPPSARTEIPGRGALR